MGSRKRKKARSVAFCNPGEDGLSKRREGSATLESTQMRPDIDL